MGLSEEEVLRLVESVGRRGGVGVVVGIGDDAAVVHAGGGRVVVSTDMMVEGVHFDLRWLGGVDVGWRAGAAAMSDMAGMGARAGWLLVSLGLAPPVDGGVVEEVVRGVVEVAGEYGASVVGGDTVRAPVMVVDVCVVGEPGPGGVVLRRGAREGDAICVSGALGRARAGLEWLKAGGGQEFRELVEAWRRPVPRLEAGVGLAATGRVHAMMDISDGLATDLARLCRASQVGAVVDEELVPIDEPTRELARRLGADALEWALCGGEDFELLVVCSPGDEQMLSEVCAQACGVELRRVGTITRGVGVVLRRSDGSEEQIAYRGYDHFGGVR